MPTTRYSELFGIPERTYRRWQARARAGQPGKGPWPRPARSSHRVVVVALATQHPAWGHRKIWAMARHAGHPVTASTVLRILDDEGLLLKAHYQRERRRLAQQRRAAFAEPPTGPNQVWQLDFSEYETTTGGPGGSAGSPTTGASTSTAGTGHRPRTSSTRSPRSNWPSPRGRTLLRA
jgi:transposase